MEDAHAPSLRRHSVSGKDAEVVCGQFVPSTGDRRLSDAEVSLRLELVGWLPGWSARGLSRPARCWGQLAAGVLAAEELFDEELDEEELEDSFDDELEDSFEEESELDELTVLELAERESVA